MFENKKTLIVVYKDELLMNQLRKLVETCDDDENVIVGTRDNSINIVSWTEKVWNENKKAGNIQGKILYLGSIKDTDKLVPIIDIRFEEYGVKFGWAGNRAIVCADVNALTERNNYDNFLKKLSELSVPEFLIRSINEEKPALENIEKTEEKQVDVSNKKQDLFSNIFSNVQKVVSSTGEIIGKVGEQISIKSEEVFRDKALMERQMLFYGIIRLYNEELETFMNL